MFFFFQAEDGIRDHCVTGVQTCALPISIYPLFAPAVCLILLHTDILLITYQRTTEDTEISNQSGEGSRQQTTVNDDTTTVLAKAEMPTTDYDTPPSNSASKQALGSCRHLIIT